MRFIFFYLALFGFLFQNDRALYVLSRIYEGAFFYCHYDYLGFDEEGYQKELSYGRKVVCLASDWSEGMKRVLDGEGGGERLAERRTRSTDLVTIDGKKYIVKRHLQLGILKGLLRMGQSVSIWNNLHWAREKGIPVVLPIAVSEKRGIGRVETRVVYRYEGEEVWKRVKRDPTILTQMREVIDKMKKEGVMHSDLRPRNMIYTEDGKIRLIDVDLMHYYSCQSRVYKKRMQKEERWFTNDL